VAKWYEETEDALASGKSGGLDLDNPAL